MTWKSKHLGTIQSAADREEGIEDSPYLRFMNSSSFSSSLWSLLLLMTTASLFGQDTLTNSVNDAKKDSLVVDSLVVDSVQLERAAVHKKLQAEIAALSRTEMGAGVLKWHNAVTIEVVRAGKTTLQVFWFDNKFSDGPWIWQPNQDRPEEWMWFDPSTNRFASVYLNLNSGTYIPTSLAEKSGLTGNRTSLAAKKSNDWKMNSNDGDQEIWTNKEASLSVELGEKNHELADAIITWLRLQPISGFELPALASKHPVLKLDQMDPKGAQQYSFQVVEISNLEQPLIVDLGKITLHDPERNLNVIAKEWAEKKKAQEGQ